ncbi:hypothetical protein FHS56_002359 [Thermonema lapsum]|uniref:Uncharacterized protein n=1 Tax=Thermonema lapsum TaxID=28195 RepID=A0A846MTA7_9BACT|nr:hypothetical protein [Thermonema lapsum]NIK74826.1 hypothetical protein [Thermonema lapsum]
MANYVCVSDEKGNPFVLLYNGRLALFAIKAINLFLLLRFLEYASVKIDTFFLCKPFAYRWGGVKIEAIFLERCPVF